MVMALLVAACGDSSTATTVASGGGCAVDDLELV